MMRHFLFAALIVTIAGPAWAETRYPLTIQNCGQTETFEAAPKRVVTIKSSTSEMLLALGLQDRIVGIGFQDGPAPPPWTEAAAALPVLSEKLPSQEVVLETEPDFIYGGWESAFSGDGAGERPALASLGIDTYVAPAACRSVKPPKLTFDAVFDEIAEVGVIFDVEDAATALVEQQRAALAGVMPDQRGLTAVWYSSGSKAPYVGADSNAPAMIMAALGLDNIMGGVDEGWTSASWEAVADADPDVIVLVDASWNSAEQKKTFLADNPVTAQMQAVKAGHYLVIPFPASEAGVRNVPATLDLSRQLAAMTF